MSKTVQQVIQLTLTLSIVLFSQAALSTDITGIWESAKGNGVIEINLAEGTGTVVSNEQHPDRVGRVLLKDLTPHKSRKNHWQAKIFVQKMGEFKEAEVSLPEPGRMIIEGKVGFISRSFEWNRVEKLP